MKLFAKLLLGVGALLSLSAFFPEAFGASGVLQAPGDVGLKLLGAGVAFGLAAAGAGVGLGQSGAAAIAAVVEKPEVRTTALIFVALAEAIAIYGFVMAIIILGQTA